MQTGSREPVAAGGGAKPPTICTRLQRAFQTRPAFRPLRRLTGRPEDGGATAGAPGGALAAGSTAAAHGSGPRTPPVSLLPPAAPPVTSPVAKAPAPTAPSTTLPTPLKPAAATNKEVGGKPQRDGQVPAATSTPTTTATATIGNVAEKAVAAGMPVPVPPSAVTGRTPAPDTKTGDKAQQTKVKTRVGSRVRKALSSSK